MSRPTTSTRPSIRLALVAAAALPLSLVLADLAVSSSVSAATSATALESIYPADTTAPIESDSATVELGTRFRVTTAGTVTGMRFYGPAVTSQRTAHLWTSTGTRLASATIASSTKTGWQSVVFATPVHISANTTYVVSYVSPGAGYAFTGNAFTGEATHDGILTEAGAGVYRYGARGGFPTQTYQNGTYYADVLFTPDTVPSSGGSSTSSSTPTTAPSSPASTQPTSQPSTTAPSTTPAAPTDDFGTSAGVPSGTALTQSGSLTVNTPGTVIKGLDINGTLTINADNVTVEDTRISAPGAFWVVSVKGGATGVSLDHVTVTGGGLKGTEGSSGVVGPGTFHAVNVSQVENAFVPGSGTTIAASYVHDLNAPGSPHYDGIQIDGNVNNITVTGSTISNNQTQTSAVMVDNYDGPATNIVVTNNHLIGGGYTVYADASFNNNPVSVTYADNRISKGYYGYSLLRGADVTWRGNVDDKSNSAID